MFIIPLIPGFIMFGFTIPFIWNRRVIIMFVFFSYFDLSNNLSLGQFQSWSCWRWSPASHCSSRSCHRPCRCAACCSSPSSPAPRNSHKTKTKTKMNTRMKTKTKMNTKTKTKTKKGVKSNLHASHGANMPLVAHHALALKWLSRSKYVEIVQVKLIRNCKCRFLSKIIWRHDDIRTHRARHVADIAVPFVFDHRLSKYPVSRLFKVLRLQFECISAYMVLVAT